MNRLFAIYRAWKVRLTTGDRRQEIRQGFGGRRQSDLFPPLTGEELKARMAEIGTL